MTKECDNLSSWSSKFCTECHPISYTFGIGYFYIDKETYDRYKFDERYKTVHFYLGKQELPSLACPNPQQLIVSPTSCYTGEQKNFFKSFTVNSFIPYTILGLMALFINGGWIVWFLLIPYFIWGYYNKFKCD